MKNLLSAPFKFEQLRYDVDKTERGEISFQLRDEAIYERLDEVFDIFGWRIEYVPIPNGTVSCTLSVYDTNRGEWVMKQGSMTLQDAASAWGIGRYLGLIDGISDTLIDSRDALRTAYLSAIGQGAEPEHESEVSTVSNQDSAPESDPFAVADTVREYEYLVISTKVNGSSKRLDMIDSEGVEMTAFARAADDALVCNTYLNNVKIEKRMHSQYGEISLLSSYEIVA